jgi:LacI family transcriptional regulator
MGSKSSGSKSPGTKPTRTPRLQDVATLAHVSLGAASRILRGDHASFSEDTRRRVLAASQQLGWRRNLLVSGMQTGRTRTVGVVIPPYDSAWVAVLAGIHSKLASADFLPITVWLGDIDQMPHFEASEQEGIDLMNRLLDRRVDGLILWPPFGLAYYEHAREIRDQQVPVVMIEYHAGRAICDTVASDEAQATAQVAGHLIELGHRRVAYITPRETASKTWATERRKGLEEAFGRRPDVEFRCWRLDVTGGNPLDVARRVLNGRYKPTAVIVATDHEALGVYQAAAEAGIRIPEQVSVVGFADLDFASSMMPPLSTVRQRAAEIGRQAAGMLLDRIERQDASAPYQDVRVPAELVIRGSTAPATSAAG